AARRLVEEEHPAAVEQPPTEEDLLLVAAREGARVALGVGRPQVEVVDLRARLAALGALVEEPRAGAARERRERDVPVDGLVEQEPLGLALLGAQADARGDRASDRAAPQRTAVDADR